MRIVPLGLVEQPQLSPDIVWDGLLGDFFLTGVLDPDQPADLRHSQGLATAVLICLMTESRADPAELRDGDENKGWPGDAIAFGAGDGPLGSRLWLLRRSALSEDTAKRAEAYARAALQPLIDQGAVVRWDVSAQANRTTNRLTLAVAGYGRDGAERHQQKYEILWDQLNGVRSPLSV